MTTIIATIHIIACVLVIVLVLLQSGKEGMGVIFGGGSGSVFGSSGAGGLLVKLTALFGALFLATSLAYNFSSSADRRASKSVMEGAPAIEQKAVPAENKKPASLFEENKAPDEQKK